MIESARWLDTIPTLPPFHHDPQKLPASNTRSQWASRCGLAKRKLPGRLLLTLSVQAS
jgi:hypothetical protein